MTTKEVAELRERELRKLDVLAKIVELLESLDEDEDREWVLEKVNE